MSNSYFSDLEAFKVNLDDNGVAEICLKRDRALNTMNNAFWSELPKIIGNIDKLGTVRAVILSSSGKHFTAGMDLEILKSINIDKAIETASQAEKTRRLIIELQQIFTQLESIRMPVISAIQGACIGGGVDMVCATDMRYCTSDAFFTIKETALGMTADLGTLQRIQRLIPSGLARELAYTSRRMNAQEALSSGFVNQVYDSQEQMLEAVRSIAKTIAAQSPMAVHGTKEMLNYSRDHSVADSLNFMATWQAGMLHSTEVYEAMQAAAQKRDPIFDDLHP
ncbi:MAG: crotonase/enoyl-CoA hydratase family protein [Porticoccaceae bacterium]|nr:crotonase/enoyl-CoA hydratase family protein [Porticoccaceae bacterium]